MTRQTWTALVSSVLFVLLAVVVAFAPVPFVGWAPGGTYDVLGAQNGKAVVAVEGIQGFATTGQLRLTTVMETRADASLSLPEALLNYWLPNRDVLPRDSIYEPGKSAKEVQENLIAQMDTSQSDAIVAGLRQAGKEITEMPMVSGVSPTGPSHEKLLPGDLIVAVDGVPATSTAAVGKQIKTHGVGSVVSVSVLRGAESLTVTITTEGSKADKKVPVIGIVVASGYRYDGKVTFGLDRQIGGPSAGLILALAVYERVTPGDTIQGRIVAGTGTIDPNGKVGSIGGIQQKLAGAEAAGATIFLVPAGNCSDLAGVQTSMRLVQVSSLGDAILALELLRDPAKAPLVKGC